MKVYDFNSTYRCILQEGSPELDNLGMPPVLKQSSLEAELQSFNGDKTGKTFVLRRSDELHAPELDMSYEPSGVDYTNLRKITATISLHVYGRLKTEGSVNLRHSVGNLRIEVGNTTDLI